MSSFEAIDYDIQWHKRQSGLDKWCTRLTKEMSEHFTYEMVTARDRAVRIQAAEERETKAGLSAKDLQRQQKKRMENNPNL